MSNSVRPRGRQHAVFAERERALIANGYAPIQRGDFATVLKAPDGKGALKLVTLEDRPFLAFLDLIERTDSPHWPEIHAQHRGPAWLEIEMELLAPLADPALGAAIERRALTRLHELGELAELLPDTADELGPEPGEGAAFTAEHPSLERAIDLLCRQVYAQGALPDLGDDNLMRRGDVPVFIDPATWG
ncbi:hypothetical protein CKO28_01475 [Rhodovibrio sodomensis]|uniref:Uncharacterized protein n=1 Tax=Rhodovibrio sodomensis TaxID=1088 RepID=A0ABS1D8L5_9PROT|nr:hypothetical protein [Rhodovibrio sodomensis]MBK1666715.1 hypothetical protein [Rhodovibrio sodomensis]